MRLYSDFFGRRVLQIAGDVVAVVFLVGGIAAAFAVRGAILALEAIGKNLEASGTGLAGTMTDIGGNLARVPFIGGSIRAPFDNASDAGTALAGAGNNWQASVRATADAVGWIIALLVVLVVALAWVTPRVRATVRRREAARLAASPHALDLLAMRALTTGAPRDVVGITADAVGSWRRGDPVVIRQLAALELKTVGIRLRPPA